MPTGGPACDVTDGLGSTAFTWTGERAWETAEMIRLLHELGLISVNGIGGRAWWIARTLGVGLADVLSLASGPIPSLHTHGLIQMLPCILVGPGGVFWGQEWADACQIDRVGLCEVHSRRGWAHVTPYPEIDEQGCNHGLLMLMSRDTIESMTLANVTCTQQPSIIEQARDENAAVSWSRRQDMYGDSQCR
ncbi:hypothetical protein EV424DRAFT_1344466 [Suillus variegatus]|nr:hypothetical protein EV424DRAFT_1344466 [Suillus variegatus]